MAASPSNAVEILIQETDKASVILEQITKKTLFGNGDVPNARGASFADPRKYNELLKKQEANANSTSNPVKPEAASFNKPSLQCCAHCRISPP